MPAKRSPPRCEHSQVSSGYAGRQPGGDRPPADRAALVVAAVGADGEDGPVRRHARGAVERHVEQVARARRRAPTARTRGRAASRPAPTGCRPAWLVAPGAGWRAAGSRRPRSGAPARGRGRGRTAGRAARADPRRPGSRRGTSGRRGSRWRRGGRRGRGRRRCRAPTRRSRRRHHHALAQQAADDDERAGQVEPGERPDGDRVAGAERRAGPAPPRRAASARCPGRSAARGRPPSRCGRRSRCATGRGCARSAP